MSIVNKFLKDYCFAAREEIAHRNFVSNEYYKAKLGMNDRKAQRMALPTNQWELDFDLIKMNDLTIQQVEQNPDISRRFMFSGVG